MRAAVGRLSGATDYAALGAADLVIEAVFEDMDVKRAVFARARPGDAAGCDPRQQHVLSRREPDRRGRARSRGGWSACTSSRRRM